jgi:hypothetical protein
VAFPYAIPQDNPFRTGGGEPTTYAYGFRNPYRFSIDPVTGQVWAGDVGQAAWEEVDKVVPGGNYGWNEREGAHCNPLVTQPCKDTGFVEPYWEYPHGVGAVFDEHGHAPGAVDDKRAMVVRVSRHLEQAGHDQDGQAHPRQRVEHPAPARLHVGQEQAGAERAACRRPDDERLHEQAADPDHGGEQMEAVQRRQGPTGHHGPDCRVSIRKRQ